MNYEPLRNLVVIKETQRKEMTEGGIFIPQTAEKDQLAEGVVLAAGPKVDTVVGGDKVIYSASAASELEIEGKSYQLLSEDNVLLVFSK